MMGSTIKIGNENLNYLEVIGGVLMICSFLLMAIRQKNFVEFPWWATFATLTTALALFLLGNYKKNKNKRV